MKFYLHYSLFFFLSIIWITCAQIIKECIHDGILVEHSVDADDIDILAASKLRPFLQEVITKRRNECFHSKFGKPAKLEHYYDAQYRHAMSALSAHEKAIKECRNDEMLVNQSASSNNQKGLRTIVNAAFEERKLCAQRNGGSPAMMEELLRHYKLQENRVMHAITVMENAEDECRLAAKNFRDNSDLRNFLMQAFNARVEDCAATSKWMNKNEPGLQKIEMDAMVANYRREWKDRFPAISDALNENQTTESPKKPLESTTKPPLEKTTMLPENAKENFWMIIAIALFCSNCAFAVCLIVMCVRKPKCRSAHPPSMPPKAQIAKDENVRRPRQTWQIPVHKSPRPLVTPMNGSRGVSVDYDNAHP